MKDQFGKHVLVNPSANHFSVKLGLAFVLRLESFSIAFTANGGQSANGKRQAEIPRLPKTRKIYLVSAYILPVATAMEQVLKTEK